MKNLLGKKPPEDIAVKTVKVNETSSVSPATINGSFSKIAVPQSTVAAKPKKRRLFLPIFLVVLIVILGVIVVFGVLPAQAAYRNGQALLASGKELAAALKSQNLEEIKTKLPQVRTKLQETSAAWNRVVILRLPFINKYHADVVHGLTAAGYGLDALELTVKTVEPFADLLGLKAGSSFVAGSAEERLQLAVKTLDKVTPKISDIGILIDKFQKEIDQIDPNRYPEMIRGIPLRSKLKDTKALVADTTGLFLNARPLLEVLPQLLGEPNAMRYLIIFQNDKELRPTGGFMTAYAVFKIEGGKFIVEKSEDIYELDNQIKTHLPAPTEILTYHKGVYSFNIRDSNLSPDFSVSMKQFQELYPNKWDFNGILTVDTHVLVEAIKILGEFNIAGRKFNAEIDKRCDCPTVIYELEDYATRPVAYVRETRKDILGELLLEIMKKALGVSPSAYWGKLFQMGLAEINQKHILAYMMDEKAQKGVESLNLGGRIADGGKILGYQDGGNWDYLHINDANMAGAKSNLFVRQQVKVEYALGSDGSLTKTLTLDYKNPAPASDCNLESGGLCLNGLLRDWIRIYVPKGSQLISSDGGQSPKDGGAEAFKSREELGKTVFEGFTIVRPLGASQVVLKYKLPFSKSGNKLSFLIQKQPGTEGPEYTLLVNGKQKEKFSLIADKVVTVSL